MRTAAKTLSRASAPTAAGAAPAAFSVAEFCEAQRISRTSFYKIVKRGSGPRLMRAGGRTLISHDAARDWQRALEQAASAR